MTQAFEDGSKQKDKWLQSPVRKPTQTTKNNKDYQDLHEFCFLCRSKLKVAVAEGYGR